MQKSKISLCLWMLLDVPAVILPMPVARAQGVPAGISYVTTADDWSQTISGTLTAGIPATVTLEPCPAGIDTTSGAGYQVALSIPTNAPREVVNVVSVPGGCTPGASAGTITFTPFYSYPTGYSIGSASSGIQETINAACGINSSYSKNAQCNIVIPANRPGYPANLYNTYKVYGTIFFHASQSALNGAGVSLNCYTRGPCLQVGDLVSSNHYVQNTVSGISFRSPASGWTVTSSYRGVAIAATQRTSQVATIKTSMAHGFRSGDMVTILFTDRSAYWGDAIILDCGEGGSSAPCASSSTTFRYSHTGADLPSESTPGVVALAYSAILDNGGGTHFIDIADDDFGNAPVFNNFFDLWDDENCTIEHFTNNAMSLNGNANWTGSFVFSAGNQGARHQIAPVITLRDSNITANASNGVTDYNSNGLYVEDTVIQAQGLWQVYSSNTTGNYQGAFIQNIYSEAGTALNPPNGAPAAITAAEDMAGTVTIASTLNPGLKKLVVISGMTPAAYNGTWLTTASSPTGFMFAASNLGKGTAFGTAYVQNALTPFPGLGVAGLIAGPSSGSASFAIAGISSPAGALQVGGTGSTPYSYFIVANDTTSGMQTSPMEVLMWKSTGRDSIPVRWPRVANGSDAITYDVIRMASLSGTANTYPFAGGCLGGASGACGYVVQALSQATACSGGLVCTYTDNGSSATSAHAGTAASYPRVGNYVGNLAFWPGSIVSVSTPVMVDTDPGSTTQSGIVGVGMAGNPTVIAKFCNHYGETGPSGSFALCLATTSRNSAAEQTGTLSMDIGNNTVGVTKGKLNFQSPGNRIVPHHIITLIDSQPALTQSTYGYRPMASSHDVWIGTDVTSEAGIDSGQLAFGAPVAITNYIAQTGDGLHSSWLERLSAGLKEFNVPTKFDQSLTLAAHLDQSATGTFAGTCTMSGATTCAITISASYRHAPGCLVTVQGRTPIAAACQVSGTTITITAASPNSETWAAQLFGNPD